MPLEGASRRALVSQVQREKIRKSSYPHLVEKEKKENMLSSKELSSYNSTVLGVNLHEYVGGGVTSLTSH